jgi:hypothetical protein
MKEFDIKKVESLRVLQRRYRLTEAFSRNVAIGSIFSMFLFYLMGVFLKEILAGSILFFLIALLCSLVVYRIERDIKNMVGDERR